MLRRQAELHGVLPVHHGQFEPIQKSALHWRNRLRQAVAVCNSLNMVNKHMVVGVDMERTMFKAVEARFLVCGSCLGGEYLSQSGNRLVSINSCLGTSVCVCMAMFLTQSEPERRPRLSQMGHCLASPQTLNCSLTPTPEFGVGS